MTWRTAVDLQIRQEQAHQALTGVLAGLSDEVAEHRPVPDRLSIAELLAHLILTERRVIDDLLLMLEHDWPMLPSIRPLEEPSRLRACVHQAGSIGALLVTFATAGEATRALVAGLSEEQELRGGYGPELGHITLGTHATTNIAYHAMGHIEEMREIRQYLGLGRGHVAWQPGWATL